MQFIRVNANMSGMDNIDNIIHGANPQNLYRFFNLNVPEKIIDFSTNVNVLS